MTSAKARKIQELREARGMSADDLAHRRLQHEQQLGVELRLLDFFDYRSSVALAGTSRALVLPLGGLERMATQTPARQIEWIRNYDQARHASASDRLPLLIDFTAAPL